MKITLSDVENKHFSFNEEVEITADKFEYVSLGSSDAILRNQALKNHYVKIKIEGEDLEKLYALITTSRDPLILAREFEHFYQYFNDIVGFLSFLIERNINYHEESRFFSDDEAQQIH